MKLTKGRPALAATAWLALALRATAATITVDSTADDLDQGPNGNCTLREAVVAANTDSPVDGCAAGSGADVIQLPPGTYVLTIPGTSEHGEAGTLLLTSEITIDGAGTDATVVTAADLGDSLVTLPYISSGNPTVTIERLTIASENRKSSWGIVDSGLAS